MTTSKWLIPLLCLASATKAQEPEPAKSGASTATPAGTQPSTAEQQFRDAWWAESGRNDLDSALRGYLAAATADGPAAVRARANLYAGRVQQRQGRTEQALASFRRVVTEFANETESVAAARVHLRELTAVDLRQNYDEWYERRLFSEEVQLVILGKLESLASRVALQSNDNKEAAENQRQVAALRNEILAFGKGALPALRKAALGKHAALASNAIEMLFELGEVPPLPALVANGDWAMDTAAWERILEHRIAGAVPATAREWHLPMLAAAMHGPMPATEFVLKNQSVASDLVRPLVVALLQDADARARLLAALADQAVSLNTRDAIAQALLDVPDDAAIACEQWLLAANDPLREDLQGVAIQRAAIALRAGDAVVLDALLKLVSDKNNFGGDSARVEAGVRFVNGLVSGNTAELLPWTAERLRTLFTVACAFENNCVDQITVRLRRNDGTRKLAAEALFADPSALRAVLHDHEDAGASVERLRSFFPGFDASESAAQVFGRQWVAAVVEALANRWANYSEAQKLDALVLAEGVVQPNVDRRLLHELLAQKAEGAPAGVKAAIATLIERLKA